MQVVEFQKLDDSGTCHLRNVFAEIMRANLTAQMPAGTLTVDCLGTVISLAADARLVFFSKALIPAARSSIGGA